MSEEQYKTYQKFNDYKMAVELSHLLKENHIDHTIEDTSVQFDPFFSRNELTKEYRIKIKQDDFSNVDNLLLQTASEGLNGLKEDYYLHHFSNEELMEVITKRDEWNEFDFLLAQKLLKERGTEVNPDTLKELKKQRIVELSKPHQIGKTWIYIGFVTALIGGLFGILVGWHISTHQKTLPDGNTIYSYDEPDRKKGQIMVVIGVIAFTFLVTTKILNGIFH